MTKAKPRIMAAAPKIRGTSQLVRTILLGVVLWIVFYLCGPQHEALLGSSTSTAGALIQDKDPGAAAQYLELSAPHIVLVRSINNLPYVRLADMAACLEAVLHAEADYFNVQRHWILNRIQPASRVLTLTKLLDAYGETYTIWEFDTQVYAHLPLNFGYDNDNNSTLDDPWARHTAFHHDRILYSVNSNGVLNGQLEYGKQQPTASWILPWTYDMMLTPTVHETVSQILTYRSKQQRTRDPSDNFLLLPIAVNDTERNHTIIQDYALVVATEAAFRFDATLRYGQHEEAWLQTLGLQSAKDTKWQDWEIKLSKQQQLQQIPAWRPLDRPVEILHSITVPRWTPPPNETAINVTETIVSPQQVLRDYIDALDIQTAKDTVAYQPREQWNLHSDRDALRYEQRLWKATLRTQPAFWRDARRQGIMRTVAWMHKTANDNFKAKVGHWHVVDADKPDNTADSVRVYQSFVDAASFHAMTRNLTIWAMYSHWTGKEDFGRYCVKQLKEWFWGDDTSLAPHFANNNNNWWDWLDMTFLLDAAKLLVKDGFLTERQEMLFVEWCTSFKDWMVSIEPPSDKVTAVTYNAILASVSFFVKDDVLSYRTLSMVPRYLPALRDLVMHNNTQTLCTDQVHRALYVWHVVGRQSQIMGIHVWKVKSWWNNTVSLRVAEDAMYGSDWPRTSALCDLTGHVARKCAATAPAHWYPLWDGYRRFCSEGANELEHFWPATRHDMPPLFDAEKYVAPFWNLGYRRYM